MRHSRIAFIAALACALQTTGVHAQQASHPPDYPGVHIRIPGVFVTPVPGAPFSGNVEILSKEPLPDGSTRFRRTVNHIARSSSGVIYNELRQLVTPSFEGEPRLLSFHLYDPQTRLNTYLYPETHIARQTLLKESPKPPAGSTPQTPLADSKGNNLITTDLGTETVAGLLLHGTRKERAVPANLSGTGKAITITDDYWLSEELKVYLVLRHNDPRTGEQTVGIVSVDRNEPDPARFQIPVGYKIVDETPVGKP